MTRLAVVYPDVERIVVNYLTPEFSDLGESCTIGVGLPPDWTIESGSHLEVALDGTPTGVHPVYVNATIRLTAHTANTTEAKRLAALGQGVLLKNAGTDGITFTEFLTGVLPTRDPAGRHEIASTTTAVRVRSELIPSGS